MVGSWGNCTQDNTTDCTSFQFRNVFCEQILANNVPSLVSLREFKKQNKSPKRWTMVSAPMLVNRLLESRFFIDQALCIWRNIWICQFYRFATKRLRTTFPRRTLDQLTLLDLGLDAASSAEMESRQERWQNSLTSDDCTLKKKKWLALCSGDLLQKNWRGRDWGSGGGWMHRKEARAWRAVLQWKSMRGCRLDLFRFSANIP